MPSEKESVHFSDTENLFLEGDNLEVLKLLQKAYSGKVKMIYIDPPYNTGNDFVYEDDYTDSLATYLEQTGQAKNGVRQRTDVEKKGRKHSRWLTMMYPRLFLARELLRDDGVIFASIDDNEMHNLKTIMDEIFGEENSVGTMIRQSKVGGGSDTRHIVKEHEYVLVYSKRADTLPEMYQEHDEEYLKRYAERDEKGRFFWDTFSRPGLKNPIRYEVTAPDKTKISGEWTRSKSRFDEDLKNGEIRFVKKQDRKWSVQFKQYLNEEGKKPRSLLSEVGGTIEGRKDIEKIFGDSKIFSYPKSVKLLLSLLEIGTENDSIVLDFFAGSGTTGQAVFELNKQDGGNRKFILVQLPEKTPEGSEARKAGYETIADIAKERLRRVVERIKKDEKGTLNSGKSDLGFRVFKLQQSNFKIWTEYKGKDVEGLKKQLTLFQDPLRTDAREIDVVYEEIIGEGYPLTSSISKEKFGATTAYEIKSAEQAFHITLEREVPDDLIKTLELKKEDLLICRDSALTDTQKANFGLGCRLKTI